MSSLLLFAVGLVYRQTAGFEFVNYDDNIRVYNNRLVTGEPSLQTLWAVFTDRRVESWAPLTSFSHMLVWQFFGHEAAVHHLVNVLLHAGSAVLLFLVLWRMTGRLWPSALVAAIFAVHPLHVESVAWVTERKDVLSALFFMLTLAAYVGYCRRPFSLVRYAAVLVCFVLCLAAKPMAVTLPCLLWLLDYWPLGRLSSGSCRPWKGTVPFLPTQKSGQSACRRPIVEKLPLLAIACLVCLWTVSTQDAAAWEANQHYSLLWRVGNALIAYVFYLQKFFYPTDLAVLYPAQAACRLGRLSDRSSFWQP